MNKFFLLSALFFKRFFRSSLQVNVPRASLLVVANDADRPCRLSDLYYSPNVDILALLSKHKIFGVARIFDERTGSRCIIPSTGLFRLFTLALIEKHLYRLIFRLTGQSHYPFSHIEYKIWCYVIRLTNTEIILSIMPSRELCQAAHDFNIHCGEVQHGNIFDKHPYYSSNIRLSEPPTWHPSFFVLWDSSAFNAIRPWTSSLSLSSYFVLGNIFSESLKYSTSLSERFAPLSTAISSLIVDRSRSTIILTLSSGMDVIGAPPVSDDIVNLVLSSLDHFNWLIRLHPAHLDRSRLNHEYSYIYNNLLRYIPKSCYSDLVHSSPLPFLAQFASLHVTELSSAVRDFSFMGVHSLVTHPVTKQCSCYDEFLWDNFIFYDETPSLSSLKYYIELADASPPLTRPYHSRLSDLVSFLDEAPYLPFVPTV